MRGQSLPAPVEVGAVRFRVAPADEFGPAMSYLVTEGTETLLESTVPVPHDDLLPALVAVHSERGVPGLTALDALAARFGLAAALVHLGRERAAVA